MQQCWTPFLTQLLWVFPTAWYQMNQGAHTQRHPYGQCGRAETALASINIQTRPGESAVRPSKASSFLPCTSYRLHYKGVCSPNSPNNIWGGNSGQDNCLSRSLAQSFPISDIQCALSQWWLRSSGGKGSHWPGFGHTDCMTRDFTMSHTISSSSHRYNFAWGYTILSPLLLNVLIWTVLQIKRLYTKGFIRKLINKCILLKINTLYKQMKTTL
jgi:hypothetical protein